MKAWFSGGMVAAALLATGVQAQQTAVEYDPGRLHATRSQLEQLLQQYEKTLGAEQYSANLRGLADDEAELIRARLRDGDFQVGDQIVLVVAGQELLSATHTVIDGRMLPLPEIGEVSLAGLLRAELKQALVDHISKYIRNPQIQVQANIRLAIFGEIANPGYHVAASEKPLTEVLMLAGGPTSSAKQKDIRIKRGKDVIWEGGALQEAIIQGRTLDQLSLRAGDEIEVPGGGASAGTVLSVLRSLPYMLGGIFAISRLF